MEAHRRAFYQSGGLLRSVAGQGHGQKPPVTLPRGTSDQRKQAEAGSPRSPTPGGTQCDSAATLASVIWWKLGYLLLGIELFLLGTRVLSELHIWWARQTGRGSCRYCGLPLTVRIGGLLRIPEGFFGVRSWCGREQPRDSVARL